MRPFDLPLGFKYATAYGGIRKQEKDDLSLIVSGVPAAAAAVFTTNKVQAAPVKLARTNMRASKGVCGAILVNAGNANCATKSGDKVASSTTKALAKLWWKRSPESPPERFPPRRRIARRPRLRLY